MAGRDKGAGKVGGRREVPESPRLRTVGFTIPRERIALFKAIIESYDNLATLRTEDPRRHRLMLYFSAENEAAVHGLLDSLRAEFQVGKAD